MHPSGHPNWGRAGRRESLPRAFPSMTGRAMTDDIRQLFPLLGKHGIEGIPPDSISAGDSTLHPSVPLGFAIREWLERTVPAPAPMRTLETASVCPVVIRSVPSSAQERTGSFRGCAQRTPAPKDLSGAERPYVSVLLPHCCRHPQGSHGWLFSGWRTPHLSLLMFPLDLPPEAEMYKGAWVIWKQGHPD